jgi:hypothetical protein
MFGLFKRKPIKTLVCEGGPDYKVIGASTYQKQLKKIAGPKTEDGVSLETLAFLVPESSNPKDKNAVAVEIDGWVVGYIRANDCDEFHDVMAENGTSRAACRAHILGGWRRGGGDEGHYGVRLDLKWPPKGSVEEVKL